jgi:hypothetical protein
MVSQQIQNIIDQLKSQPNSEWRNKVISHLKDSYASSIVMEGMDSTFGLKHDSGLANEQKRHGFNVVSNVSSVGTCICIVGTVDRDCPIHGGW